MATHCPYLFIDEAHHAEAPTWSAFKERFRGRRILQFTATPFREDGRPLDGDIIFKYPLSSRSKKAISRQSGSSPSSSSIQSAWTGRLPGKPLSGSA